MSDCESIPFEDHKQLLDDAEQRIAELEARLAEARAVLIDSTGNDAATDARRHELLKLLAGDDAATAISAEDADQ